LLAVDYVLKTAPPQELVRVIREVLSGRESFCEQAHETLVAAILIMEEMGTPGEGTRPTRGRFCGGCRPGALIRRGVTGP
jgi:hypothetical protein